MSLHQCPTSVSNLAPPFLFQELDNLANFERHASILRHARVNLFTPRRDATGHIEDILESRFAQDRLRLRATAAHLAVHNDLRVAVELAEALGDIA